MTGNISNRLEIAKEASINAGKELLKFFREKLDFKKKEDNTVVSQADIASSRLIYKIISTAFPGDGYVCEERDEEKNSSSGFGWIIDPLDGTTNFIRGNADFSVSICLAKGDSPIMGMVYAPYRNELYWAVDGQGAWVEYGFWGEKKRLKVAGTRQMANCIIEFPGGIEITCRARKEMELIKMFYPGVRPRITESAALALCRVASGEQDAYIHPTEKPHDFAAGSIIVRESGGKVTNFLNGPLSTRRRGILAGTGNIHKKIVLMLGKSKLANRDYWLEDR